MLYLEHQLDLFQKLCFVSRFREFIYGYHFISLLFSFMAAMDLYRCACLVCVCVLACVATCVRGCLPHYTVSYK